MFARRGQPLVALFRSHFVRLTPAGARHDEDLYEGDVVELFVAPDAADRRRYLEIEVNPAGVVFDARVSSPHLGRGGMEVDRGWDPAGLQVRSRVYPPRRGAAGVWLVRIALDLGTTVSPAIGAFRIDRRSLESPVLLALAPTGRRPADFHVPERFVAWTPSLGPLRPPAG